MYRGCSRRLYAVEQLRARDEGDAEAGSAQDDPRVSRIALHIMHAALDRSDGNGIGDKIGLKAGLDDK